MLQRKTALVLSAGGMFGAYQAGVWKALAEREIPDLILGASVGALNGWCIAGGCSPERLIEDWQDPASGAALQLFPSAGWRRGWFDPEPLRAKAERIFTSYTPRLPFALTVVRWPRLRTEVVRSPDVTAAHLFATCSIPVFLPSVTINGSRYLDGGLLEKLPLRAAAELGATRIIAVDSLPALDRWWLRAGTSFVRLFKPSLHLPDGLDLTVITPSEDLGDVNDAVFWRRENIDRWVDMGVRDARAALRSEPEIIDTQWPALQDGD
jgi:NTE family protein